MLITRKV